MALTPKQQRFVDAYDGNGTEACRRAGYVGNDKTLGTTAYDLLKKPEIRAAIAVREAKRMSATVASREGRQHFWATVIEDPDVSMRDRLRASELLGKSNADFVDRVEHSGALTLEQLVLAAKASPPAEAIAPAGEKDGSVPAPEPVRSPDSLPFTPPDEDPKES